MFNLDEDRLEHLFARSSLLVDLDSTVLFGLRGCLPVDVMGTGLAPRHKLEIADINYVNPRCTIGYWQPGKGFAVFPGSTVPHRRYVSAGLAKQGDGVNRLMLGLHRGYTKGDHALSHPPRRHRALRMERPIPVQRSADDLDFDADDRVEIEAAFDNLHAAWTSGVERDFFASAGCQVIVGSPRPESGPWKMFVEAIYGMDQRRFDYGLFDGREALRVAEADSLTTLSRTVRWGSKGELVARVQQALRDKHGFDMLGVDSDFGRRTLESILAFQRLQMNDPSGDGIVGPQTAAALGIAWPTYNGTSVARPEPGDGLPAGEPRPPVQPDPDDVEAPAGAARKVFIVEIDTLNNRYFATEKGDGVRVYLGYKTKPKINDGVFVGFAQVGKRLDEVGATRYDPADWKAKFGVWAHLLLPTAKAESDLWFERVNTYDRAKLTYGFFQLAAHTPDANLIVLLKRLLELPEAASYFPDLKLRVVSGRKRLFRSTSAGDVDLEAAEPRRPGSTEMELKRFMAYLNPTLDAIEESEIRATAALLHWARTSEPNREIQVAYAVELLQSKMRRFAKSLHGRGIAECIFVADILHQGRGGGSAANLIAQALDADDPVGALALIGSPRYQERIDTVQAQLKALLAKATFKNLRFDKDKPGFF